MPSTSAGPHRRHLGAFTTVEAAAHATTAGVHTHDASHAGNATSIVRITTRPTARALRMNSEYPTLREYAG